MVRHRRSVACCGVGSWSRGRGNGGVVGRLGRQGTGLCRLLWSVEETGKRSLETRFRLLGLRGQRKRRCVLAEWLHGLRDGHASDKGIGRILYKGFLCPLSKIPGLPLRVVYLSVCRVGLPLRVVYLSVCRVGLPLRVVYLSVCRVGLPLRARCCGRVDPFLWAHCCGRGRPLRVVSVCLSVVWASLRARCCRRSLLLRARCCGRVGRPSCSWALVSGLVTMSSIAMNRTGFKRTLFVLLLDSDRACCCPGCPLKLE